MTSAVWRGAAGSPGLALGPAFVVRAPGSTLEASEVQRWVSEGLAPFKVPTIVTFIESLPHNAVGKVMKHLIGKPANLVEE